MKFESMMRIGMQGRSALILCPYVRLAVITSTPQDIRERTKARDRLKQDCPNLINANRPFRLLSLVPAIQTFHCLHLDFRIYKTLPFSLGPLWIIKREHI
jgi:hypothetical protein